jgi:hypothetical protein
MQAKLLNLPDGRWVIEITPDPPEEQFFMSLTRPLEGRRVGNILIIEVADLSGPG